MGFECFFYIHNTGMQIHNRIKQIFNRIYLERVILYCLSLVLCMHAQCLHFYSYYLLRSIEFTGDIRQLRHQQIILLILTILLIVFFVLVHGFHLFRWLRKKDYLSFKSIKQMKKGNKARPDPLDITVANPHTQSPRSHRKSDQKFNSIYSVSGESFFLFLLHKIRISCNVLIILPVLISGFY